MARRRRRSRDQMRELLRERERGGVSLKAIAGGVPYTNLAWWRTRPRDGGAPRFVPVRVEEARRVSVEIVVGDVVVRVTDGDERAVARLVRAILSC